MKKAIFLSLLVSGLVLACLVNLVNPALAETCGDGQYGTVICPPTDVTIDKTVRNPITGVFVENLLSGDATYSPGSEVTYKLKIVNSSNQSFDEVKIEDILPDKVTTASVASYDKNKVKNETFANSRLKFQLANRFEGNTTVEIDVHATVKDSNAFAASKSIYCGNTDGLQNTAQVRASDRFDEDSASICVQSNVLGVTTLPKAGLTDLLPLVPFIGTGLTGITLLFRKGRKS